jgi:hypothetical protein
MAQKKPETYKAALLIALEKSLGLITPACKEVGVSRETYYRYYKEDPDFKKKVDEINDIQTDFVESQLFKKIKSGSERSILFYMKYKGRKRGYTDSIDLTSGGEAIKNITFEIINKKKNDDEDIDGFED